MLLLGLACRVEFANDAARIAKNKNRKKEGRRRERRKPD